MFCSCRRELSDFGMVAKEFYNSSTGLLTGTIKLKDSIMFLCRLEGFDLEVFYKGSVMVLPGFTVLVSEASGVLCL